MPAKGGYLKPAKGKRGQRFDSKGGPIRRAASRVAATATSQAKRTSNRYAVTGPVKGVDAKDGFSKKEDQLVRKARRRQKSNRNATAANNLRKRGVIR